MKQKYSWLITVSAILLAGALVSCESDASFGSQDVEVVPGPSNPEGNPDNSYSSSQTSGSSSSVNTNGNSSSANGNTLLCDFGDGDCEGGYTASECDKYGGDVVTTCPVAGSSSSTSGTDIGCLMESGGYSQCTMLSEADCQYLIDQPATTPSITISIQDSCD